MIGGDLEIYRNDRHDTPSSVTLDGGSLGSQMCFMTTRFVTIFRGNNYGSYRSACWTSPGSIDMRSRGQASICAI
jgi:hypothetical protein